MWWRLGFFLSVAQLTKKWQFCDCLELKTGSVTSGVIIGEALKFLDKKAPLCLQKPTRGSCDITQLETKDGIDASMEAATTPRKGNNQNQLLQCDISCSRLMLHTTFCATPRVHRIAAAIYRQINWWQLWLQELQNSARWFTCVSDVLWKGQIHTFQMEGWWSPSTSVTGAERGGWKLWRFIVEQRGGAGGWGHVGRGHPLSQAALSPAASPTPCQGWGAAPASPGTCARACHPPRQGFCPLSLAECSHSPCAVSPPLLQALCSPGCCKLHRKDSSEENGAGTIQNTQLTHSPHAHTWRQWIL